MKTHICHFSAILLAVTLLAGVAHAETLWSIGQKDSSYADLAIAGKFDEYNARFTKDVAFVVGKDEAAQKWPYVHPGPSDAWAGGCAHPYHIEWNLDRVPKGVLRLSVYATNTHDGSPLNLQAAVNDSFESTMTFKAGEDDRSLTDPQFGRRQSQSCLISANKLHKGKNTITLTVTTGSWLLYDAVVMEKTDIKRPSISNVTATSTPFFRQVGPDLKQAVRVTVQNDGLEGKGVLSILDTPHSKQKVRIASGSSDFFVLVAPFTQTTALKAVLKSKGKKFEASFEGRPERKWRIYVAPSVHTDIGYSDLQEKVFERHNANTASVLKACETNPDFKWNMEVFAQVDWFRKQGDDAFKTLDQRITEGRIGLTGMYLNMLTGLCTGEEMAKVLEPAQEFGRARKVPVTVATITDVPTTIGTLPMFLKQAGVKYFVEGINETRGPVFMHADKRMIQSPFWWEGMDGSRVMAIFTRGYAEAQVIGLRNSVDVLGQKLPGWIKAIDRPYYPCDAIYCNGAGWDNESVTPDFIDVAKEWNKSWAFPQIIVARADAFFQYVEQNFAQALPVFRGDMGSYWEDGAASSANETGMNRIAKAHLNAAERWCALAAARNPKYEFPQADFAKAWEDAIYYDEHTWGAAGSISDPKGEQTVKQWEYKAAYAHRAAEKARDLFDRCAQDAFTELSQSISGSKGGADYVTVRNACSWPRDILVNVPCDGREVSLANSADGKADVIVQGEQGIIFEAKQVPAVGYRRYKLEHRKNGVKETPLLRQGADEYTWESPAFRYKIDPKTGAFVSIEDLRTHREWVDASSGYGVNQFLYVTGGNDTSLIQPGAKAAPPLQPVTTRKRTSIKREIWPHSQSCISRAREPACRASTRIA